MPVSAVQRPAEAAAIAEFLERAAERPTALLLVGDAGIGKTTVWLSAADEARARGFHVLAARPVAAETVLAYACIADMLAQLDDSIFEKLPDPQRRAIDRLLLRAEPTDAPSEQRTVGAALLSTLTILADSHPVLIAIDDVQWLDSSSRRVLSFALRRLFGPIGLVGALRTPASNSSSAWVQLPQPDDVRRVRVRPLQLGATRALLSDQLHRTFTRPVLTRIQDTSGGNPFYALELARAIDSSDGKSSVPLPDSLSELVSTRIGHLDDDVLDALLTAASQATPTVELVARGVDVAPERAATLLEKAESAGIVSLEGHHVRFTHPLLAHGVYASASPARRRRTHRRLADAVDDPELHARHRALASTIGDSDTLHYLDDAAEVARTRGAPAAAAEFLALAADLGGDTPARRLLRARHHYDAGDSEPALTILDETLAQLEPGPLRAEVASTLATMRMFGDSFAEAADLLERAIGETDPISKLTVEMLIMFSFALLNSGRGESAVAALEHAVEVASAQDYRYLLGTAIGMRVLIRFMAGAGVDEADMNRALELCDGPGERMPIAWRPDVLVALLLAWTGQLDAARTELLAARRECVDLGEEGELTFVQYHIALIEIWRGDLAQATLVAEDMWERAQPFDGGVPRLTALSIRGTCAAYAGRVDDARSDLREAISEGKRSGSTILTEYPRAMLGFLEVSIGDYNAALVELTPLLATFRGLVTEIIPTPFVPDLVETFIHLGDLDEAERLLTALEDNGARLTRPWMLATGKRCRAMLLAAKGEVDAALEAASRAMTEHDRLPMPFERARTQLLLGQLQRRTRQRDLASATLGDCLTTFTELDTPLWAAKARSELARANIGPQRKTTLTASERRVAELAASGMTNREVANTLFISPKTVEANLARVYRKLGIRSRAELGRYMANHDG